MIVGLRRIPEAVFNASRAPGATYFRMLSNTCALYSTPSWFGTVSSNVSAAAMASSLASCFASTPGSAA
jgi:ABC-type proline/glycine betaine transport system permease subunit